LLSPPTMLHPAAAPPAEAVQTADDKAPAAKSDFLFYSIRLFLR
jgi:hypothetical protein